MRKRLVFFALSVLLGPLSSLAILFVGTGVAHAAPAYNPSYLISDKLFTDYASMSASDIQSFLISENSGLKNVTDAENCSPPTPTQPYTFTYYQHCSSTVQTSAAQIIADAAVAYQISPKAILATLQKEQSLVTTPNPTQSQINLAMGYNCPGGHLDPSVDANQNGCYDSTEGFFNQVDNGAWDFRKFIELMNGRNWWGKTPSDYPCLTSTAGTSLYNNNLLPGNAVTFTDPGGNARTVTLQTSATAALYCYTPFVGPISDTGYSGSYNFVVNFEQWFGSVSSPCYNDTNITGAAAGERVLPDKIGINHTDNFAIVQPNNTGTACLENYIWQNGSFGSWQSLTASITPAVNPANSSVVSADLNGDGIDELYLVDYNGTGSGRLEVHGWTANLQGWSSHIATISPQWSHADAEVISCDPAGYGHDNLFLVEYRGTTSGDIEIHEWAPGLQQWVNHWDTHYGQTSPQNVQIVCGDPGGTGKDGFYYIQYAGFTGSGRLEIHGGITNLGYNTPWPYSSPSQWPVHTATISGYRTHLESDWLQGSTNNMPAIDSDLIFADTVGNGVDRPYIIQYHGTASGRVEVYQMSNDFKSWVMLTTTNQASY